MSNIKDTITTIAAVLTVAGTAVQAYLQANAGDINYLQLGVQVAIAIAMYFVGKNANGTTKSPAQIAKQQLEK